VTAQPGHRLPDTYALPTAGAAPLTARGVLRMAFATYRARFWRVAGVAVFLFAPLAVLQTGVERMTESVERTV